MYHLIFEGSFIIFDRSLPLLFFILLITFQIFFLALSKTIFLYSALLSIINTKSPKPLGLSFFFCFIGFALRVKYDDSLPLSLSFSDDDISVY